MDINITLYSKDNCSQCEVAKNYLNMRQFKYTVLMLGEDFSREEIKEKYPNARAFPVVLVDDEFIGSFRELLTLLENKGKEHAE